MKTFKQPGSKRRLGFSLVELLVAMAITIIVLGAALMMFVKSTDANDTTTQMAEAQANARAGANLLTQDLSQAGTQAGGAGGIQLPSGPTAAQEIFAIDATGTNYLTPNNFYTVANTTTMYGITPAFGAGPVVNGQAMDGINMVYADPILDSTDTTISNWPLVSNSTNPTPGQGTIVTTAGVTTITFPPGGMTPPVNDPNTGIQVGDILLFSNTTGQAVGMVTTVTPPNVVTVAPGDTFVLNQTGIPGSITALGTNAGVACTAGGNCTYTGINVMRLYVISYFLQPLDANNNPVALPGTGAVDYRLMKQLNALRPTIVAEHIDYFRLFYDLADPGCPPTAGLSHIETASEPATCPSGGGPAYGLIRTVYVSLAARAARPDRRGQFLHVTVNTAVAPRSLSFHQTYPNVGVGGN